MTGTTVWVSSEASQRFSCCTLLAADNPLVGTHCRTAPALSPTWQWQTGVAVGCTCASFEWRDFLPLRWR